MARPYLALSLLLAGAVTMLALPGSLRGRAEAKPADESVSKFMKQKLEASSQALEGIVTEDYELIRQGAEKMIVMSKATEWVVIQGPVYAEHSADFRRACDRLAKMAAEKNAEGAALAHMQVTMSCINCHAFVRTTKLAGNERGPASTAVVRADIRD